MKRKLFKLPETWHAPNNDEISCKEKIKMLNKNIEDLQDLANDILDDAVLMGVDENQFLKVMKEVISSTNSSLKSAN